MKMRSRTRSALAALTVAVLAMTACTGNANDTSAGSPNTTLTIQGDAGNPTLVENFNPFQPSTSLRGNFLIYEPLEIRSPIDGAFTPFLATGHKFTDASTLVFTIRQGVKWSDGTPFTPADVIFTFDLLKKYPALDTTGVSQQIAGVSSAGDTVTVKLSKPNVPFAGVVGATPIVAEHIWSAVPDPTKYVDTRPVGTGPFTLTTFAPTEYSLDKNASYWQAAKVAPSKVVFPAQSSNQSTNQLDVTSGKFDWAYNFLPDVQNTYVARDPKRNVYWFPPGGAIGLFLNLTKAPYTNVDFRKGVSLALNRDTIALKAVNGYLGQASQSGLILPNLEKWLDPALPNQGNVSQDTTAAMAEFGKAGYTMRNGQLVGTDGQQATTTITLPTNFSDWVAAAKEVATELGAVGVKVTLDLPQYAQYSQTTQAGTFDAAMGGFGGTGDPYTDFNNALNSSFVAPVNTPSANNFQRFKDPTVDSALATLAAATDMGTQLDATHQLEQAMFGKLPVLPMYYGGSWGLFSTKNFTGWPSANDSYTLPTTYNNSLLTVLTRLKRA